MSGKIEINNFLLKASFVLVILIFTSCAGNKNTSGKTNTTNINSSSSASSRDLGSNSYDAQRSSRKSGPKIESEYDKKVEEYKIRMRENAMKNAKIAKEMQKPQYSDPSYFGHKKKPKKRPLGKRKFCKECGIVH